MYIYIYLILNIYLLLRMYNTIYYYKLRYNYIYDDIYVPTILFCIDIAIFFYLWFCNLKKLIK